MRRPSSTPPELPGYTFDRILGSGGFSDVFLYEQHLPKRRVAVKVLLIDELTPANRAAFVAEANLMAQLSAHPYIVTIYHADVAPDDRPYFVMEYCSGPSLGDRYKQEAFAPADALRTGIRLASAVATAHSAGILHRDIKPANVLSNDFGWPALTDFGISSAVDDDALPLHTQTLSGEVHSTAGTTESQSIGMSVPWSPPEMFEDDPKPDVRSDVFSLAATIYTILAGHTPFEVRGRSNGTLDLIGRIERGAITPMVRTDLPQSLIPVLLKGMAADRRDRFATAVDFARALQRVEMELGYTPTAIDIPNLVVDAPRTPERDNVEDATRARGATTINAQPVGPAVPTQEPSAEATRIRGAQSVDAQPVVQPDARSTVQSTAGAAAFPVRPTAGGRQGVELPEATVVRSRVAPITAATSGAASADTNASSSSAQANEPGVGHESGVRQGRAGRVIAWVSAAVVVALVGGVVAGVLIFGPSSESTTPTNSPKPGDVDTAVVDSIPAPTLVSVTQEGSSVVFTVANPKPEDGDTFVWKRIDRTADSPMQVHADGAISVDGYQSGQSLCIEVAVRRSGQISANPLQQCYPE